MKIRNKVGSLSTSRRSLETVTELKDDDYCGCGSSIRYVDCCKRKNAGWARSPDGSIIRQVELSERLEVALDDNKEEFQEIFGRDFAEGDLLFFGNFLTNSLSSGEEVLDEIIRFGREAGVKNSTLYATKKTGFMLSESNMDIMTPDQIQEWDEAVDEYEIALESGVDLFEGSNPKFDLHVHKIAGLAKFPPIHFGSYVSRIPKDKTLSVSEFAQSLILSRVHQLLVSLYHQIIGDTREEVFMLVRSIYECYLIFVYLEGREDRAEAMLAQGFVGGKHYRFKVRKDGLHDRRIIVDTRSGKEFPSHTSFYKMAEASPVSQDVDFFDVFYESLSRHVHFSFANTNSYFDEGIGFSVDKHVDFETALIIGFTIIKMMCDAVAWGSLNSKIVKSDAVFLAKKIRSAILDFLKAAKKSGFILVQDLDVLRRRLKAELRA